jgi:ABC-2 type transport system ATP-binding protein
MRVDEFLKFRAKLKSIPKKRIKRQLDTAKEICSLTDVGHRIIGQLSRGYWQRIGLADSLLHSPAILILDEPTIGLDPNQIRSVRETIKSLAGRYTIILSTHYLSEAEMICRRVLILNEGKIVASDAPENLMGALQGNTQITSEIFGPPLLVAEKLRKIRTVVRVTPQEHAGMTSDIARWCRFNLESEKNSDIRSEIYELISGNNWKLRELRLEKRHLEDVFVEITSDTSGGGHL